MERERRSKEAACVARPQKAQQGERLVYSKWEKAQKHCRVENMPEDAQLLELG